MKKADFLLKISETTPFETEVELDAWIKRTDVEIRRKQRKMLGEESEPEEEPTFPLVDRPDSELTEEEIKEKRRQRLMKAGWEARLKVREEKQRENERLVSQKTCILADDQEDERRKEEEFRATDPAGWSDKLRAEQEVSKRALLNADGSRSSCACRSASEDGHNWAIVNLPRLKVA